MSSFYEEDLAYIHHVGYDGMARGAAPGLLALLRGASITGGLVVDLGCGSGIWLGELTRAGYDAAGVDISPAFLELARENAPKATLHLSSAHDFEPPPCAAVTAISEVLCYTSKDESLLPFNETFRRVYGALQPGGMFVFDLIVQKPGERMAYQNWREGKDWATLVELDEDEQKSLLRRKIVTFRKFGDTYRRGEETHTQQVVSQAEIEVALQAIGFSVKTQTFYGEYQLAPRRMAFIAQKPS